MSAVPSEVAQDSPQSLADSVESSDVPKDSLGGTKVSQESVSSDGTAKMSTAVRPSSLKPPSKISRPCAGQTKPTLPTPTTPYEANIDTRRDEFRRQKLTDVEETDENDTEYTDRATEMPSPRKTRNYSVSSSASMDTLWDLHPRRLSEAGLRRHSDTSVVLTEDTDCFIIGMKVWVGGTKPGQIAYLGETQFAPGEWAGIVLDEPIGKNDGSVSGIRYFQCEAKRGVFSRLTRLTLAPLPDVGDAARTPANGARRSVSPAGSTRSLQRVSPSLNTSTTSLSSVHHDFKVGDRVIVKSTQGSKLGTLRFLGPTEFANGEWAGVELDDPLGKNDGSVEGKRYFQCEPRYGLFAPAAKVSKSPSNRRPGQCVVHKGPGADAGLRRAGSRESISSAVSAASSARRVRLGVTSLHTPKKPPVPSPVLKATLQDVLREKEHHIEQLLKEREIERSEVTRVAGRAEEIDRKLKAVQLEYDNYRAECEVKFHEHLSLLSHLKKEKTDLSSLLDDERKKLEDVQFRFEEESLNKDDIEVASKNQQSRIKSLEDYLSFERHKNDKLERENKHLIDTQKKLLKAEQELEEIKLEAISRSKRSIDEKEHNDLKSELKTVKQELSKKDLEIIQKNKAIEELDKSTTEMHKEKDQTISRLKKEINEAIDKIKSLQVNNESNLSKTINKLEIELSSKTYDFETMQEKLGNLENENQDLRNKLASAQSIVDANCKNIDKVKEDENNKLQTELSNVRKQLNETIQDVVKTRRECSLQKAEKDMTIRKLEIHLSSEIFEISKLKNDMNETIKECTVSKDQYNQRHKRQIEIRESESMSYQQNYELKCVELNTCQELNTHLENEICTKNLIIEKWKSQVASFTKVYNEQQAYIQHLIDELTAAQASREYEQKLQMSEQKVHMLESLVEQLRAQLKSILDHSQDSEKQMSFLNDELKKMSHIIDSLKTEMHQKLIAAAEREKLLSSQLSSCGEQNKIEIMQLQEKLNNALAAEQHLRAQYESMVNNAAKTEAELKAQIEHLNQIVEQHSWNLKKQLEDHEGLTAELKGQLQQALSHQQQVVANFHTKIEHLNVEIQKLNTLVREKMNMLAEAEEKLKYVTMQAQLNQQNREVYESQMTELTNEIATYKRTIEEANIKILSHEQTLAELRNVNEGLQIKIKQQEQVIVELNEIKENCHSTCAATQQQLFDAQNIINQLSAQSQNAQQINENTSDELNTLKQQLTNLMNDKMGVQRLIEEKQGEITMLTQQIHQLQQQKVSTDSVLHERENKIIALLSQLESVQKEKGTHTELFAIQEKKIIELDMQVQRLTQEKVLIQNIVQEKEAKIDDLMKEIHQHTETFSMNIQEKEKYIINVRDQIVNLQHQLDELQQTVHEKESNLIILKEQMNILETEKTVMTKQIYETEQNFLVLKNQLSAAGDCKQQSSAIITQLEKNIHEKENAILILHQNLDKLQQEWNQPMNNPYVKDLTGQLEEKNQIMNVKENQIMILNNEIKVLSEQTQNVEQMWHHAEQEWKVKLQEFENIKITTAQQCNALEHQIVVLQQQADHAGSVESELEKERVKYEEIYHQLTIAETQKADLVKKLEEVTLAPHQEECTPIIKIIKEIHEQPILPINLIKEQVENDKVAMLQTLEATKVLLMEKERELVEQRNECSKLTAQLLNVPTKVIEVQVPVPGPVQVIGCTEKQNEKVQINEIVHTLNHTVQQSVQVAGGQDTKTQVIVNTRPLSSIIQPDRVHVEQPMHAVVQLDQNHANKLAQTIQYQQPQEIVNVPQVISTQPMRPTYMQPMPSIPAYYPAYQPRPIPTSHNVMQHMPVPTSHNVIQHIPSVKEVQSVVYDQTPDETKINLAMPSPIVPGVAFPTNQVYVPPTPSVAQVEISNPTIQSQNLYQIARTENQNTKHIGVFPQVFRPIPVVTQNSFQGLKTETQNAKTVNVDKSIGPIPVMNVQPSGSSFVPVPPVYLAKYDGAKQMANEYVYHHDQQGHMPPSPTQYVPFPTSMPVNPLVPVASNFQRVKPTLFVRPQGTYVTEQNDAEKYLFNSMSTMYEQKGHDNTFLPQPIQFMRPTLQPLQVQQANTDQTVATVNYGKVYQHAMVRPSFDTNNVQPTLHAMSKNNDFNEAYNFKKLLSSAYQVNAGNQVCDIDEFRKLVEEYKLAQGQVEFLNNIIVDMQRKNEHLQTKISLYESGTHLHNSEDHTVNVHRRITPRVYCDICEIFDSHDTEDCPIQSEGHISHERKQFKSKPRLYCELCEVFGHDTADCESNETF